MLIYTRIKMSGKIVVSGGTGLIGSTLIKELTAMKYDVVIVTRNPEKAKTSFPEISDFVKWEPQNPEDLANYIEDSKAVINLSGAPVFAKWKGNYSIQVKDSRVLGTRYIVESIKKTKNKPGCLINGSATGIYGYGKSFSGVNDESGKPSGDFWGSLVHDWENEAILAENEGVRTVLLRTSLVLEKDKGALEALVPYFMKGLGGYVMPGKQIFSWIHIKDEIGVIVKAIENTSFHGPVNLVAGNETSREFSRKLGKVLHKRSGLPIPQFVIKRMFGTASDLVTGGSYVESMRMNELGYKPVFKDFESAISDLYR